MKSTVPVGTGEKVRLELDARGLDQIAYVSNPEFLREGRALADFMEPDRIVIGASDDADGQAVADLYADLEAPVIRTDVASAEMIKYGSNAFLATKISFINEIANVCEEVGADVSVVAQGMGLDDRIGPHFLRPGIGFGGSCFPKDVNALKQLAGNSGYHFQLLTAVIEVNELQKRRVVGKLERHLGSLRGRRIALLGLAFKANTDDMREASSLVLAARLRSEGADVVGYDPVAMGNARAALGDGRRARRLAARRRDRRRRRRHRDRVGRVPASRHPRRPRGDGDAAHRRRSQPARPAPGAGGRVRLRVGRPSGRPGGRAPARGRSGGRRLVIAVVLVGGEGTRLRPLTYTTPKPMLPIANRPFLEHQVEHLRAHGVDRIVLACGYKPDAIRAHFGSELEYVVEPEPLGTGGAIAYAAREAGISETFVACNGDVLTDLDLTALVAFHRDRRARMTIALHPVDDPSRYGVVATDADGAVTAFIEKPPPGSTPVRTINAGTYVAEPDVLDLIPPGGAVSVEYDVFPRLVGQGLYALADEGAWRDIGTPESFLAANLERMPPGGLVDPTADVDPTASVERSVVGPDAGSGPARGCANRSSSPGRLWRRA